MALNLMMLLLLRGTNKKPDRVSPGRAVAVAVAVAVAAVAVAVAVAVAAVVQKSVSEHHSS